MLIRNNTRHATEADAIAAGEAFKRDYPPQGYDSRFHVWKADAESDAWVCSTSRYSSCD